MAEARWFVRMAAVLVGLANLIVLAHFFGGSPALPTGVVWGAVSLRDATPSVLAAVVAGLVTAEVAIRRFDRLSAFGHFVLFEKLSHRRAGIVGTVCLGGALMGVGLSAVFVLQGSPGVTGRSRFSNAPQWRCWARASSAFPSEPRWGWSRVCFSPLS